jgi:hypothetical protein
MTRLNVRQAMPFLRKRTHCLGQKGDLAGLQGYFTCMCHKQWPLSTQEISQVKIASKFIFLTKDISSQMHLNLTGSILNIQECSLAHAPQCHDTPRQRHLDGAGLRPFFGLLGPKQRCCLTCGMGAVITARKWVYAFAPQSFKLLSPAEEQVSAFSNHDGVVSPLSD